MEYEHIGRRVVVHIAAEVDHIETVVVGPTDFVAVGRAAAGHIAEEAVVDSIDSVAPGSDTETLVMEGMLIAVAGLAVVGQVCYIPPALGGTVMRGRHMEQG